MTGHGNRVPVPEESELRDDVAALLPLTAQPGREPAKTMAILARRPELLPPFLGWAAALALEGAVPPRDHELLALRVASSCRSEFEWDEHVEYGRNAGLTDQELADVARSLDDGAWPARERALLTAVDELTATFDMTDATWGALAEHYDAASLVEIVFVVGQYTMLSMVANAAGLDA
jgi:alkylhydroperoxidase family enzyme